MIKRPTLVLTRQETNVLELSSKGKLNPEIAKELNISLKSIEGHKTKIYKTLGVTNITHALEVYNKLIVEPLAAGVVPTNTKHTSLKSRLNVMIQKYAELSAVTNIQSLEIEILKLTTTKLNAELALAHKAVTVVALKAPVDNTLPAGKYNGAF